MRPSKYTRLTRIERLEPRFAMDASASVELTPDSSHEIVLPKTAVSAPMPTAVRRFASSHRVDVNQDKTFSTRDVLTVINALSRSTNSIERLDVNDDGRVSALDALILINELHRAGDQPPLLPVSHDDVDTQRQDAVNFVSNTSATNLPDSEMVETVAQDFARIVASFPDLAILVDAPSPGSVFVFLTAEDVAAFDAGEFHRLDELNAELNVDSISRNDHWGHPDLSGLILRFEEPYRWDYLQERYKAIDGIRGAHHPGRFRVGGPYGIRLEDPRQEDGSRVYNFQFGSGDCPSGCLNVYIVSVRVTDSFVERYVYPVRGNVNY